MEADQTMAEVSDTDLDEIYGGAGKAACTCTAAGSECADMLCCQEEGRAAGRTARPGSLGR